MRRRARRIAAAAEVAVCMSLSTTAMAAPDPFYDFSVKYRCPVTDRIRRLYAHGDPAVDRDRFIAIEMPDHRYVQCRFHGRETRLECEAWSGFFERAVGAPRTAHLPPDKIAALGRLGFSTDGSAGNFGLDVPVPAEPDFGAIADLMLRALYDAFDARADATLAFAVPFAPGSTHACDPVG